MHHSPFTRAVGRRLSSLSNLRLLSYALVGRSREHHMKEDLHGICTLSAPRLHTFCNLRDASAFDRPRVSPTMSASARTSATSVCDTIPLPSPVTLQALQPAGRCSPRTCSSPRPDKDFDTPIVPGQEHFLRMPHRPAQQRREFSGLNAVVR
jgi:hypothetical protein